MFFRVLFFLLFFTTALQAKSLDYDFDGDGDVDGKDLAEWAYYANFEMPKLAYEYGGIIKLIEYFARKIDGTLHYKASAWPSELDPSTTDIEAILAAIGADSSLVLAADTYGAMDLDASGALGFQANNQTLRSAKQGDPLYGTLYSGEVILDGEGDRAAVLYSSGKTGWKLEGINPTGATDFGDSIAILVNSTGTIDRCVCSGNKRHLKISNGTVLVKNSIFVGKEEPIWFAPGTASITWLNNICKPADINGGGADYGYGPNIQIQGTGTYKIYQSVFAGTEGPAISTLGTPVSGTVDVQNNIFTGCGAGPSASGTILSFSTSQTSTAKNNIINISGSAPAVPIVNADTESGNIFAVAPLLKSSARRGYVYFSMDDYSTSYDSWGYLYGTNGTDGLLAKFAQAGVKLTWHVDVAPLKAAANYQDKVDWILNTGIVEIGLHTRSSCSMAVTNGTKIFDVSGAITIDREADTITSAGGILNNFKNKTLEIIKILLESAPHNLTVTGTAIYNTYASGSINSSAMGEVLANSTSSTEVAVLVSDYTEGLYKAEIVDAKAELEAITGLPVNSMSYPYGEFTSGAQTAARMAGLTNARAGAIDSTTSYFLSNLARYRIGCAGALSLKTNSTGGTATENLQANANGLMSMLAETGGIASILSHGVSNFTYAEWDIILAEVAKWSCVSGRDKTASEIIGEIMETATDNGDGTITYPWTDQSDYTPGPGSPAIGNGAIIPGIHDQVEPATDINGDPVLLQPNIGPYDGRSHIDITGDNYTPTDWSIRKGAVVNIHGGGNIDMSGLSETTGTIDVVLYNPFDGFTGKAGLTTARPFFRSQMVNVGDGARSI